MVRKATAATRTRRKIKIKTRVVSKKPITRKKASGRKVQMRRRNPEAIRNAYNRAYDLGFDQAYNEGYNAGYAEGLAKGEQDDVAEQQGAVV